MLHKVVVDADRLAITAAAPALVRREPEVRPISAIACRQPAGRTTICVRAVLALAPLKALARRKAEFLALL